MLMVNKYHFYDALLLLVWLLRQNDGKEQKKLCGKMRR
jgi:hypothetical protein